MNVIQFDPRPPARKPDQPHVPFVTGLAWAMTGLTVFWLGVGYAVVSCSRAVWGRP